MPKILRARPAQDQQEERQVRKLAASRHGPADWIQHAKMVVRSWEGARVDAIAAELHCRPLTVRRRLHRFDAEGFPGLGDRPRPGRSRRLTPADDSALIALVHTPPPGRLVTQEDGRMVARDEEREARLSPLSPGAGGQRRQHPGQTQPDPDNPAAGGSALARGSQLGRTTGQGLRPKRTAVVSHYVSPPAGSTTICTDELGPGVPRTFPRARGWSVNGHRENRALGLRARTREDLDLGGPTGG